MASFGIIGHQMCNSGNESKSTKRNNWDPNYSFSNTFGDKLSFILSSLFSLMSAKNGQFWHNRASNV
jgi:hypothetical protein